MNITITLTHVVTGIGPFNILTNVDGFVTPIATGVSKDNLLNGYIINVDNSTTEIRLTSTGNCTTSSNATIVKLCNLTQFAISTTLENICVDYPPAVHEAVDGIAYHNGINPLPQVGDTIYYDCGLTPYITTGSFAFYDGTQQIATDNSGIMVNITCK